MEEKRTGKHVFAFILGLAFMALAQWATLSDRWTPGGVATFVVFRAIIYFVVLGLIAFIASALSKKRAFPILAWLFFIAGILDLGVEIYRVGVTISVKNIIMNERKSKPPPKETPSSNYDQYSETTRPIHPTRHNRKERPAKRTPIFDQETHPGLKPHVLTELEYIAFKFQVFYKGSSYCGIYADYYAVEPDTIAIHMRCDDMEVIDSMAGRSSLRNFLKYQKLYSNVVHIATGPLKGYKKKHGLDWLRIEVKHPEYLRPLP